MFVSFIFGIFAVKINTDGTVEAFQRSCDTSLVFRVCNEVLSVPIDKTQLVLTRETPCSAMSFTYRNYAV